MRDAISSMMKQGASDEDIRNALLLAGWSERDVRAEMSAWVRTPYGPVPRPDHRVRNIIKGLALLILLGTIACNLVAILFRLVEILLPDPAMLTYGPHWRYGLTWPAANLFVLCPLLYVLKRRLSPFPVWTATVSAFLVYAVLIGDAITALHGFLSGNGDAAFFLKCLVVSVVALLARRAVTRGQDA